MSAIHDAVFYRYILLVCVNTCLISVIYIQSHHGNIGCLYINSIFSGVAVNVNTFFGNYGERFVYEQVLWIISGKNVDYVSAASSVYGGLDIIEFII